MKERHCKVKGYNICMWHVYFLWFSVSKQLFCGDALYIFEGVRLQEQSMRVWGLVQEERL